MPRVTNQTLVQNSIDMPSAFKWRSTLLLFRYIHRSPFYIDDLLIGLDINKAAVDVYQIHPIKEKLQ